MKTILKVKTKMTKKDYENFHYLVAFRKNPLKTFFIFFFTLAASILGNLDNLTNIQAILKSWLIFSLVILISIIIKIKFKVNQVYQAGNTSLNEYTNIEFMEDRLRVYSTDKNNFDEVLYKNIFKIYESKKYFLVYLNKSYASVIRKEDLRDIDKFKDFLLEKFPNNYKKI